MPSTQQDPIDVGALVGALVDRARDATYVAVGLGVLGIQRAQAARRRMARGTTVLDEVLGRSRSGAGSTRSEPGRAGPELNLGPRQVGEWLDGAVDLVSSSLRPFEEQLPEPAREIADRARTQLRTVAQLLQSAPGG